LTTEIVPYEETTDLAQLTDTARKEQLLNEVEKKIKENQIGAELYITGKRAKLAVEFHRNIIELLRLKLMIIESINKKGGSSFQKIGDSVVIISEDGATKIVNKLSGLLYK